MAKNIFISFSFAESNNYKEQLVKMLQKSKYGVDYSEKVDRSDKSDETIWKNLKNRISGSSIMLVIYSKDLEKGLGGKGCKVNDNINYSGSDWAKEGWVYKEIKCGLRDGKNNAINGIMVIVPDDLWSSWDFKNAPPILIENYNNKKEKTGDLFDDSYIPFVSWSQFQKKHSNLIQKITTKRDKHSSYNIVKKFN